MHSPLATAILDIIDGRGVGVEIGSQELALLRRWGSEWRRRTRKIEL